MSFEVQRVNFHYNDEGSGTVEMRDDELPAKSAAPANGQSTYTFWDSLLQAARNGGDSYGNERTVLSSSNDMSDEVPYSSATERTQSTLTSFSGSSSQVAGAGMSFGNGGSTLSSMSANSLSGSSSHFSGLSGSFTPFQPSLVAPLINSASRQGAGFSLVNGSSSLDKAQPSIASSASHTFPHYSGTLTSLSSLLSAAKPSQPKKDSNAFENDSKAKHPQHSAMVQSKPSEPPRPASPKFEPLRSMPRRISNDGSSELALTIPGDFFNNAASATQSAGSSAKDANRMDLSSDHPSAQATAYVSGKSTSKRKDDDVHEPGDSPRTRQRKWEEGARYSDELTQRAVESWKSFTKPGTEIVPVPNAQATVIEALNAIKSYFPNLLNQDAKQQAQYADAVFLKYCLDAHFSRVAFDDKRWQEKLDKKLNIATANKLLEALVQWMKHKYPQLNQRKDEDRHTFFLLVSIFDRAVTNFRLSRVDLSKEPKT